MDYEYICAKCKGGDYFMSTRPGAGGKLKDFPVCRTCDEIMHYKVKFSEKELRDQARVKAVVNFFKKFSKPK